MHRGRPLSGGRALSRQIVVVNVNGRAREGTMRSLRSGRSHLRFLAGPSLAVLLVCVGSAARSEEPCPPALRLHGDGELTGHIRAELSPGIRLVKPEEALECEVSEAWVSWAQHGVTLVVRAPWGTESRAVQSVALAVALLESWSVPPPSARGPDGASQVRATPIVLEPEPPRPAPVRHFSVVAQLEGVATGDRSLGLGASLSAGPVLWEWLRPFLLVRGNQGLSYPDYYVSSANVPVGPVSRESTELEFLVGAELEWQPARGFILTLGTATGLGWSSVTSPVLAGGLESASREFVDPRIELRAALGVMLDDSWGIELASSVARVRDLSRTLLPEPTSIPDYDGFLPALRIGLGIRWSFTTEREAGQGDESSELSSDPGDYQRSSW